MLTKCWDDENAPAAMMDEHLRGRVLFKFFQFSVIVYIKFHTRASIKFTPPLCRRPSGQYAGCPRIYPEVANSLGFDLTYTVSTLLQRFTCVRLLDRHMTRSSRAFSITLTTLAFDQRSLWLFEACSCKPASEGLPPSLAQHRV
jgi:hypothetical protein